MTILILSPRFHQLAILACFEAFGSGMENLQWATITTGGKDVRPDAKLSRERGLGDERTRGY